MYSWKRYFCDTVCACVCLLVSSDDETVFADADMLAAGSATSQSIRWSHYQPLTWRKLLDEHYHEMSAHHWFSVACPLVQWWADLAILARVRGICWLFFKKINQPISVSQTWTKVNIIWWLYVFIVKKERTLASSSTKILRWSHIITGTDLELSLLACLYLICHCFCSWTSLAYVFELILWSSLLEFCLVLSVKYRKV